MMIVTNNVYSNQNYNFQGNYINKMRPLASNKIKKAGSDYFVRKNTKNKSIIQRYFDKLDIARTRKLSLTASCVSLGLSISGMLMSNPVITLLGVGVALGAVKISNGFFTPKIVENVLLSKSSDVDADGKLISVPKEDISHKIDSKKSVSPIQEVVRQLFLVNYSNDVANNLAVKYKNLLTEENDEEFLEKTTIELLKDFDLSDVPIRLKLNDGKGSEKDDSIVGSCLLNSYNEYYKIQISRDSKLNMFKTLVHEITHVKQDILMANSCSENEFIAKETVFASRLLEKFTTLKPSDKSKLIGKYVQSKLNFYNKYGIRFNIINEFDENYSYARRLFDESDNLVNKSNSSYYKHLREKGAFFAEYLAEDMIEQLD